MNSLRQLIFALASLVFACACTAGPSARTASWPSCLGNICFDPKLPDAKSTVQQFGVFSLSSKEEDKLFCYSDHDRYMSLTVHNDTHPYVSNIYLSNSPICSGKHSMRSLEGIATPEGLLLGDTVARAFELYGEPNVVLLGVETIKWAEATKRMDEVTAESELVYGPMSALSLFQASVYIKAGQVSGIELSNSE